MDRAYDRGDSSERICAHERVLGKPRQAGKSNCKQPSPSFLLPYHINCPPPGCECLSCSVLPLLGLNEGVLWKTRVIAAIVPWLGACCWLPQGRDSGWHGRHCLLLEISSVLGLISWWSELLGQYQVSIKSSDGTDPSVGGLCFKWTIHHRVTELSRGGKSKNKIR